MIKKEIDFFGKKLSLETGRLAKQADGAVLASLDDVVVLVTAVSSKLDRKGLDFLPFSVDYREKTYAAGKIPGGFFKREGRPNEKEILTSRLIDRPLRPLFPDGYFKDVQVMVSVLCTDQKNDPDVISVIGASAALLISNIPLTIPVAAVRVGRIDGKFIINPTYEELEKSDINLIVAGTKEAVTMVEGGASEISEADMLEAVFYGHESLKKVIELQEEFRKEAGKEKVTVTIVDDHEFRDAVRAKVKDAINAACRIKAKLERQDAVEKIKADAKAALEIDEEKESHFERYFGEIESECLRTMIVEESVRADGRGTKDIRQITCEIGVLPRTHGTAVFTRGETQSLSVVTLGTSDDEQIIDALEGESRRSFMLHYNFPPFSVNETSNRFGPGRREIGHGNLAERALKQVLPSSDKFPYTLRIVSEILESNGSSSMATVCSGSLSLMDAGVPIKAAVAGIAMGLIKEGEKVVVLSDILGLEDHLGDMDFKVAGTKNGITAFQMDIKILGVTKDIVKTALEQAKAGRLHILGKMDEVISKPRESISAYAPRILTININPSRIGELIGPGGKNIRSIIERTKAKIDVDDTGRVNVSSVDSQAAESAVNIIKGMMEDPEVGKIYLGKVKKIMDFGAFVEILPGTEGLVHISQLENTRVKSVRDVLNEGDEVLVKLLEIDKDGKLRLSRKEALGETEKKVN
ncbi:MAG: polyribonucleotide nucleotidyltransferase [Candidatus Schekmanbacteria bacterium]|nr:polyribonucleotide nucleotidyltransferase [Candidatus Schekmanbacteria bacterium]